jgi:hypothetical protein
MRLRKLAATLVVALAGAAMVANTASAAATTVGAQWYVNGVTLNQDLAVKGKLKSKFTVLSTIGGKQVHFTATGLDCVACVITNAAVTGNTAKTAIAKGRIKWTGVTLDSPKGCTVRNKTETGAVEVLETTSLVIHFDWMIGTKAYAQFMPESGSTLATAYLEGGECAAIEGPYNLTGTLFGKASNETGVEAVEQGFEFSPAIQTETGAALKLGSNAAELSGAAGLELESGSAFGAH